MKKSPLKMLIEKAIQLPLYQTISEPLFRQTAHIFLSPIFAPSPKTKGNAEKYTPPLLSSSIPCPASRADPKYGKTAPGTGYR